MSLDTVIMPLVLDTCRSAAGANSTVPGSQSDNGAGPWQPL